MNIFNKLKIKMMIGQILDHWKKCVDIVVQ